MTILYVDDDPEDLDIFKEAVSAIDRKIVCYIANDGSQGLQVLDGLTVLPDLIFLDINMPVMTGKEFLIAMQGSQKIRGIPVVIYTTSTLASDFDDCKRLGAVDFITKPANFSGVKAEITRVLSHQHE